MKKLINFVRKTLSMSPSEARGVVFIFFGMIILVIVPFVSDYFFGQKQATVQILSPKKLDSLTISLDEKSSQSSDYQRFNKNYERSDYKDSPKIPVRYFQFNPNTASVEQLQELGIPKFIANRIDHYRSKGGKFRKKEDLGKIYDFPDEVYQKIEAYITLPSAESESENTPQGQVIASQPAVNSGQLAEKNQPFASVKPAESNFPKSGTPPATFSAKNPQKFDMNLGDTTAFKNIAGIGSGYAKRIVKLRDLLGGFANAEQVRETFGLPPETADELLKFGFVKSEVKHLKINELPVENLRHPYLRFFQAKAIIAYRDQHGKFKSAEDLKQIKVLDEATIEKIKPYLEF
jgi:competence protein ComEA